MLGFALKHISVETVGLACSVHLVYLVYLVCLVFLLRYLMRSDAARLAGDPMHKLAVGRDQLIEAALAWQPTLSRLENAAGPRALYRIGGGPWP